MYTRDWFYSIAKLGEPIPFPPFPPVYPVLNKIEIEFGDELGNRTAFIVGAHGPEYKSSLSGSLPYLINDREGVDVAYYLGNPESGYGLGFRWPGEVHVIDIRVFSNPCPMEELT